MDEPELARPRTLAEKLDYLLRVVHPKGRGEYTYREVAQAINDADAGTTISASYLWQLRRGDKDNPTIRHVEALARFFGVPPSYFLDDAAAGEITAQLELLAAMRDGGVREIALRASDLSDAALKMIKGVIENTRELEGLKNTDRQTAPRRPRGRGTSDT
ncbi:MAG: helix-turn-helix domain-containing protein [Geminicoccaceae bacterium]